MHEIYELKEQLMKELEEYGRKGEMSTGSLEVVDKLAHTIKNLCKIIEAAEEEEEYSMAMGGGSYARGGNQGGGGGRGQGGGGRGGQSNRGGRSYEGGGGSYARGRGRNARRDSRGRYSSEGGYSYGNDEMIEQLEELMEEAPDQVKQDIQRLISKVENM